MCETLCAKPSLFYRKRLRADSRVNRQKSLCLSASDGQECLATDQKVPRSSRGGCTLIFSGLRRKNNFTAVPRLHLVCIVRPNPPLFPGLLPEWRKPRPSTFEMRKGATTREKISDNTRFPFRQSVRIMPLGSLARQRSPGIAERKPCRQPPARQSSQRAPRAGHVR